MNTSTLPGYQKIRPNVTTYICVYCATPDPARRIRVDAGRRTPRPRRAVRALLSGVRGLRKDVGGGG